MAQTKILLDSNSYFRLAKSIRPKDYHKDYRRLFGEEPPP